MKSIKMMMASGIVVLALASVGVTALAATSTTDTSTATGTTSNSSSITEKQQKGTKDSVHVSKTDVAAAVLGKTTDEIKVSIKVGTSLGKQLTDAGKLDAFKTAYLAELKTKLTAAVTAGTITQEKADTQYASAETKINAWDGSTELSGSKGD